MIRSKVSQILQMQAGQSVLAKGWVRTKRGNKEIAFVALNDGSTIKNLQVVVDKNAVIEYAIVGDNAHIYPFAHIGAAPDGSAGWSVATVGPNVKVAEGAEVMPGAMIYEDVEA